MKFERLLEEYHLPEWSDAYLPYGFLKKRLYDIAEGRTDAALGRLAEFRERQRGHQHQGHSSTGSAGSCASCAGSGAAAGAGGLGMMQRRPSRLASLDAAWSALKRPLSFESLLTPAPSPHPAMSSSSPPQLERVDSVSVHISPSAGSLGAQSGTADDGGLERASAATAVEGGAANSESPVGADGGEDAHSPRGKSGLADGLAAVRWKEFLEAEMIRISKFVDRGLRGCREKFVGIERLSSEEQAQAPCAKGYNLELRQLEVLSRLAEDVEKLRGFSDLNHVAFFKIMKKYDKVLKADDGAALKARIAKRAKLGDTGRFDELSTCIRQAFLRSSPCQGLDGSSLEIARLAAGLSVPSGEAGVGTGRSWAARNGERLLFFFLGSSTSLFAAICILIVLPGKSPSTFSTGYFMANFCAFRVVLSVVLTLWAMGTVARVCEEHFINASFLLGVDPRCRVGPSFLFLLAALLTSVWIVVFGMYVIDYKWMVLPEVLAKNAYNKRASGVFVLYPALLLLVTIVFCATPSRVCRNRYKRAVLGTVRRTCLAPFHTVSFADNIAGDVLTSLAKPLQEVPATWCYLIGHHPMWAEGVDRFVKEGTTCPEWERKILNPVIAGAPFWFRLLQCARRFVDTRDPRHLLNFGKYAASLLVVVVTSYSSSQFLIVSVSAVATIYAAAWDVLLDWGLDFQTLALLGRGAVAPAISRTTSLGGGMPSAPDVLGSPLCASAGGGVVVGSPVGGTLVLGGFGMDGFNACSPMANVACEDEETARPLAQQRHFTARFYCCAVLFDVLARFTWVLTLMPITLLSDDIVQRALLQTLLSSAEIARRALWAILRLENEQVTNASGYRAFLWVPLKAPNAEGLSSKGKGDAAKSSGASKSQPATPAETPPFGPLPAPASGAALSIPLLTGRAL